MGASADKTLGNMCKTYAVSKEEVETLWYEFTAPYYATQPAGAQDTAWEWLTVIGAAPGNPWSPYAYLNYLTNIDKYPPDGINPDGPLAITTPCSPTLLGPNGAAQANLYIPPVPAGDTRFAINFSEIPAQTKKIRPAQLAKYNEENIITNAIFGKKFLGE